MEYTLSTDERKNEAALHVLWHLGDPRGVQPGDFTTKLLEAWDRADAKNSARLTSAFSYLGEAIRLARTGGPDAVAEWGGVR